MYNLPPEPKGGEPILGEWGARVIRYLRMITPQSSPSIIINTSPNGTTFFPTNRPGHGNGAAAETDCPFDVTITAQEDPSTLYDIAIRPGTVNSQVPAGLVAGLTAYDPADATYVKIKCQTDGKGVTSSTLEIDTTPPAIIEATASTGSAEFDILIAVLSGGVAYKTLGWCGSIRATLEQVFLEDKASPAVGESPYTRWYKWKIEAEE